MQYTHINDFNFDLPSDLIAQYPPKVRGASRLLVAPPNQPLQDNQFTDFIDYFESGDVLVMNNTQVIKARLFGQKATGGKIEALIERILDENTALAHIRSSKSPKAGSRLIFNDKIEAECLGRQDELFVLEFSGSLNVYEILEQYGEMPLPPYIERKPNDDDDSRYQTVYCKQQGAVAAPTAGLHFTPEMLHALKQKGVILQEVTLHVGAGTFQPVRVENIKDHKMHHERYTVQESVVNAIQTAQKNGKKICAVGTTSLRALEAASLSGTLTAGSGDTDIFITPGFQFRTANMLLTNFHLPKSTLLMLVSAFAGYEKIRHIYQHAIEQQYRFFSYGDAMLLYRQ
ncbi:MAG: tRNA preQ1(34) S-adenosylmethionine ribosyltransferase-isomerase QueA [Neisseriaceae bacterium]|nr:tRNA preQ1(34) S-adenosylmethionine ribosyltransferase-isomerase QueA [Neisseriaceae bacterium]